MAKCKALNSSGMTCYHWCGGYTVPPPTATGSIQRDMVLIDSCLGVGEVAVSDHRSSVPSVQHLANIARCLLSHGTWHMAHGTWHMAHGTWQGVSG